MSVRRRSRSSPGLKWIFIAVVVTGAVYYTRPYWKRAKHHEHPATAFYEVKRADMLISIVEEGALRALNETVVRSSLEGVNRIIQLATEGAAVKKGELLVEFDASGLSDRLNELELQYQERLFQLSQATENLKIQKSLGESQIKDGELQIENAQSDLEKYRDGDAPLQIKTVEARSGVISEQVRIATERHARTQELFKAGNATRSELEADALSLKREQLALGQYQEDLRLIKKYDQPNQVRLLQSKVEQAEQELERLKQRLTNEIAQAEADLKTSQRTVSLLEESIGAQKRRLANTKIFAPQDGLVVYASVSPFQNFGGGGNEMRTEGRQRGNRGPGGGGGGGDSGEFRGARRSGGSGNSGSGGSSSGSSSTSQAVAAANQRAASAISGASAAQSGAGGSGSEGGARSLGSGGAGSGASSSSGSFVSYPSMRPSSTIPAKTAAGAASGSASSSGSSSGSSSLSGSQNASYGSASQFNSRSSSQFYGSFGDFNSTPGLLEPGTMVRQRQELIRLPDVSKMLAEIRIHESRVRQVRPGMTAYVRIENIPDQRFKATVRRIAPLPDAQMSWLNPNLKVYPTDLLIEDDLPNLKPGVSARAEVVITNLSKVLSVPIQTVTRLFDEDVCFVKNGSKVIPVPVVTGLYNDRFIEITSGLKEGDRVLLAPVGDETISETPSSSTNEVETATEAVAPAPTGQRPIQEAPMEERRFQRPGVEPIDGGEAPRERRGAGGAGRTAQPGRNSDASENGEAPTERRRNRQGQGQGRRPQNAEPTPE